MNNAKNQPIIDGDILGISKLTPVHERIMIIEDRETEVLYWRYQLEDVSVKNELSTLQGDKYITLSNIYRE